jgi:hypothetical protein
MLLADLPGGGIRDGAIPRHQHEPQGLPGVRGASAPVGLPSFGHSQLRLLASLHAPRFVEVLQRLGFLRSAVPDPPLHGDRWIVTTPIARPTIPDELDVAIQPLRHHRLKMLKRLAGVAADNDERRHVIR